MFLENKDKSIRIIDGPDAKLLKEVTPGIYSLQVEKSFFGTKVSLLPTDRYNKPYNITAGIYEKVINYIDAFIDPVMVETRREMGKLNKLGLIFNGLPGTGKTFLAGQIGHNLVQQKGAVVIVVKGTEDSYDFAELIDQIREHDPNRFIMLILDEFEKDRCRTNLLAFLDGSSSKDNMLIIGTTNSTAGLPNWVTERPSRFERVFEFTIEDKDVFESIINSMIPEVYQGKINIEELYQVAMENKLTIDAIGIEVMNAIYRYKKQLVDPQYILSHPYSYIDKVVKTSTPFEPVAMGKQEDDEDDNDLSCEDCGEYKEECSCCN